MKQPEEKYQLNLVCQVARVISNRHKGPGGNRAFKAGTQDREHMVENSADFPSVLYLGASLVSKKKNR